MSVFDDMAKSAKAESETRLSEQRNKAEQEAADRDRKFRQATDFLENQVRPVMEEAAHAFARNGVKSTIERNWADNLQPTQPALSFKCKGDQTRIASTGGHYTPEGVVVSVLMTDGKPIVRGGKDRNDRTGSFNIDGDWKDALTEGIKRSLKSYHASIEEIANRF